ncbi:porin family protein [Paracoccus sp. XHP0099]|uniref:Porin family protein n=1 Tax=Paracoccus marinaquae TaxID=2841926 RepID=A0ABS6AJ23_9RHOB|nr:porin family protein [Paracoccus marinaquae]
MPAFAQDSDWDFDVSIYLFAAETDTSAATPAGTIDSTLSFSDALSDLKMGFMGAFGASNGQWSFVLDYLYYDLGSDLAVKGPRVTAGNADLTIQIMNGYAGYRIYDNGTTKADLVGGLRWFDVQSDLSLTTAAGAFNRSDDTSWTFGLVGARLQQQLAPRWQGTVFVDYGGFSSDDQTWQVLLTADYAINDDWAVRGGYRYLAVEHGTDRGDFSFRQSGPVLAAVYKF